MKRRTFLSALAALFTMLVISFTMTTSEATAQQDQNCCRYIVDIAGVPDACFPFSVCTFWANGFPTAGPFTANGVTAHPLPWPCPPSSVFFGASLAAPNCQFPIAAFNEPVCYVVNGCRLMIRIGFDGGCVRIHVRPC